MFGFLFAHLFLQHGFQQTESQRGLGCSTGLGDVDDAELFVSKELHEFCQIILSDIISRIHYVRVLAVFGYKGVKRRTQRLIHSAGTQI